MPIRQVTNNVAIEVTTQYFSEHSQPEEGRYIFGYKIRISNLGLKTVQLVSRRWLITDAKGETEEVEGPGVVGQQPHIAPGSSFEYESFCPLPTKTGSMQGSYQMLTDSGEKFETEIPQFFLVEPSSLH